MRGLIAWLAPAGATFLTWWLFLGMDSNGQYTVPQVASMVVVLIAIGLACGWLANKLERLAVTVSAVVGISAACWLSWSDDETGLFMVGWLMVTAGVAAASVFVVGAGWALHRWLVREQPIGR